MTFAVANGNAPPASIGPSGAIISVADRSRFENLYNDLLGRPGRVTQTFYSNLKEFQPAGSPRARHFEMLEHAEFVQDDWKLRSDLRVSEGIPLPRPHAAPLLQPANARQNTVVLFHPNLRTGYVQQYSVDVQRELWRNTVLEAAYLGTRGVKLLMPTFMNQRKVYGDFLAAFRELQESRAHGAAVSPSNTLVRLFGSPAAAIAALGAGVVDQGAVGAAADTVDRNFYQRYASAGLSDYYLRNYPQFNNVVLVSNDGRMYYDALRTTLRRNQGAVKFAINYTWSKTIDNLSMDPALFRPIDSFNLRLARAVGDYSRTHVLNSMLVFAVPVGRGKRFAGRLPPLLEAVVGGWEVGELTVWESGVPFTATSGRLTTGLDVTTWANYAGDRGTGSVQRRGDGVIWFAPETVARFSFPGAGEIGSSGRNAFRGPRVFNLDMSLVKSFRIAERHRIALRGELYNTLNNVNFALPQPNLSLPGFGRISAQDGSARTVQIALRYEF